MDLQIMLISYIHHVPDLLCCFSCLLALIAFQFVLIDTVAYVNEVILGQSLSFRRVENKRNV